MNQNPEQIARDKIDKMLVDAGWLVQSKDEVNFALGKGIALRETKTESGSADYILFINSKAIGVIEAKAEEFGFKLLQVEEQSVRYSKDSIKIGKFTLESEKPFVYGTEQLQDLLIIEIRNQGEISLVFIGHLLLKSG